MWRLHEESEWQFKEGGCRLFFFFSKVIEFPFFQTVQQVMEEKVFQGILRRMVVVFKQIPLSQSEIGLEENSVCWMLARRMGIKSAQNFCAKQGQSLKLCELVSE